MALRPNDSALSRRRPTPFGLPIPTRTIGPVAHERPANKARARPGQYGHGTALRRGFPPPGKEAGGRLKLGSGYDNLGRTGKASARHSRPDTVDRRARPQAAGPLGGELEHRAGAPGRSRLPPSPWLDRCRTVGRSRRQARCRCRARGRDPGPSSTAGASITLHRGRHERAWIARPRLLRWAPRLVREAVPGRHAAARVRAPRHARRPLSDRAPDDRGTESDGGGDPADLPGGGGHRGKQAAARGAIRPRCPAVLARMAAGRCGWAIACALGRGGADPPCRAAGARARDGTATVGTR